MSKKLYPCWDCLGSGVKKWYMHRDNGVCYTCNGSGETVFDVGESTPNQKRIMLAQLYKQVEKQKEIMMNAGKEFFMGGQTDELGEKLKEESDKYNNLVAEFKELQKHVPDVTYRI